MNETGISMDKRRHIVHVLIKLDICKDGYEISEIPSLLASSTGLDLDKIDLIPALKPLSTESKRVVKRDLLEVTRHLIELNNAGLVADRVTKHKRLVEFCDRYGVPIMPNELAMHDQGIPVDSIFLGIERLAKAILKSGGGEVSAPKKVLAEFENPDVVKVTSSGGVSMQINNVLLAAWFDCISLEVTQNNACEYCAGPNLARAGARFCGSYCRDRWNKDKLRGKLK